MRYTKKLSNEVVVIGGGAAGMMSAITAARNGRSVTLIERNGRLGKKLSITGKGRCNLTNDCSAEEVLANIPRNSRFLYSAMNHFPPRDTMAFFESLGVPLKTERGGRVFPVSDHAGDIVSALQNCLLSHNVKIKRAKARDILIENNAVCGIVTDSGSFNCRKVILATGGMSYPLTGSTGDGYRIAEKLGHTMIPLRPSLVPLVDGSGICSKMQGLSLKNVALKIKDQKDKVIFEDFGELLFTHFGMSGPLVLSASAHMRDFENNSYTAIIDLKPALDEKKLDARLLRDFEKYANRDYSNALSDLYSRLMIPVIIEESGIDPSTKVHSITKAQRQSLLQVTKSFSVPIRGARPIDEAIITSGGVKVSEIDPRTMASKLVDGLFFAGEIIDADAYTGGFNLQIAWATGNSAGNAV